PAVILLASNETILAFVIHAPRATSLLVADVVLNNLSNIAVLALIMVDVIELAVKTLDLKELNCAVVPSILSALTLTAFTCFAQNSPSTLVRPDRDIL